MGRPKSAPLSRRAHQRHVGSAFNVVAREIFAQTGIQLMQINTLPLYAMRMGLARAGTRGRC
jgi:hypothetical protein